MNESHGMSYSYEYRSWIKMKERCYNPNHQKYDNYGGRGIKVCDEWLNSFENFYRDMGNRPSLDFSLDRIDNDKGYNKDNCKWSNYETQNRNRRVFKTNKTGYTGISKDKSSGKYKVGIEYKLNGKRKSVNLGSYKNISDAILARKEGEKKYWGRK